MPNHKQPVKLRARVAAGYLLNHLGCGLPTGGLEDALGHAQNAQTLKAAVFFPVPDWQSRGDILLGFEPGYGFTLAAQSIGPRDMSTFYTPGSKGYTDYPRLSS